MTDAKTLHVGKGIDLPWSVVTSKAAILAMTGQGKTYLAKAIAEEMLNRGIQIVVGDYTGVWWGLTSSASGKREGKNVVVFGGEFADVPINEHSGGLIADLVVNERISAVLDVSGFEDDAPKIRFMTAFAKRLYFKNRRPIHFFLDEADEFVPQNPQRDQIGMLSVIKRIWQRGRIKGIGGTLISQRSAVVNKSLLSQSEILIALRTVAPQDRKALASWFESWGTEEQIDEFQRTISNLPDHTAWFWSPKHQLFVQGKARQLETFDSGATPDVAHGLEIDEPKARTQHDIARFGKEIERLAVEAASDDPARLKKQLAAERERSAKAELDLAELRIRHEALKKSREKKTAPGKPIKVPAISPKTLKEIRAARKALGNISTSIASALRDASVALAGDAEAVIARLDKELSRAEQMTSRPVAVEPAEPARVVRMTVPARPAGVPATNGNGAGGSVTGGQRRILTALAQFGPSKPGRIRILAGIDSPDTLRTYLGKLKQRGEVWGQETITITPEGERALGTWDRLPEGAALLDYWRARLGSGGKGDIFRALLDRRSIMTADEIMTAANIKSADTLRTYIGQLKQIGLVESNGSSYKVSSEFAGI